VRRLLFAAVLLLLLPDVAAAQVDRATLTGVVRDPSNAVVANATVSVTHIATNVITRVTTDVDGTYLVLNLAPGEYLVEATTPGFQPYAQVVEVTVGSRARLAVSLAVGGVSERINVQATVPLLDTQSAVVGTTVGQHEVANLPLAIRNWDDLLFTLPGVQGDRYT
jgi:hypothetical protein